MRVSPVKIVPLLLAGLLWLLNCQLGLSSNAPIDTTGASLPKERLNTNWITAVKVALGDSYSEDGTFDFHQATNLLGKASKRGNYAARGLWGITLMATDGALETRKSGLWLLTDAAENGDVPSMCQLGVLYKNGRFLRQDYPAALHWFLLAADQGSANAQFELGVCFYYGYGTNQDSAQAFKYYQLSAAQTNYSAMNSMGFMLMNGFGTPKNLDVARYWSLRAAKEGRNRRAMYNLGALDALKFPETNAMADAFEWDRQSAELGDGLACQALANFYFCGWGVVATNSAAFYHWRAEAARLGATDSQYQMGVAYRTGDGVPEDVAKSLEWYRKAAAKNHPRAFYDLAQYYWADKTNPVAKDEAHHFTTLAAQGGYRQAQLQCALSCFRGDGAPVDFEQGKKWLDRAAEADWANAQFCLFELYWNGIAPALGCPAYPKDKKQALLWLRRAATHHNLIAQSILAVMLIHGTEIEMDKAAAEKLLRDAAAHGYGQAQNDLGYAIEDGDTATNDLVESAMWLKLAIAHTTDTNVLKRGSFNLAHVTAQLSPEQNQEADRRANDFRPQPIPAVDPMPVGWEKNPGYQAEDGQYEH
jgi:TPR repeat protein